MFAEKDKILEREQYWIDTLNSKKNGYNIADASFGDCLTNHPLREEIISKIKKTLKDKNSAMSVEERKENRNQGNSTYAKTLFRK